MNEDLSIATKLKVRLKANDEEKADLFADAMIAAAIDKNTTAMKMVVELVEPPKKQEAPTRRLNDDELVAALDRIFERIDSRRDQPSARS